MNITTNGRTYSVESDWYTDPDIKLEKHAHVVAEPLVITTEVERIMSEYLEHMRALPVVCLDCRWTGTAGEMKAQACPVCDGRCADV